MSAFGIEVFYDGACPLCAWEVRMLQSLDRDPRIRFINIAASRFDLREVGVPWAAPKFSGECMPRLASPGWSL